MAGKIILTSSKKSNHIKTRCGFSPSQALLLEYNDSAQVDIFIDDRYMEEANESKRQFINIINLHKVIISNFLKEKFESGYEFEIDAESFYYDDVYEETIKFCEHINFNFCFTKKSKNQKIADIKFLTHSDEEITKKFKRLASHFSNTSCNAYASSDPQTISWILGIADLNLKPDLGLIGNIILDFTKRKIIYYNNHEYLNEKIFSQNSKLITFKNFSDFSIDIKKYRAAFSLADTRMDNYELFSKNCEKLEDDNPARRERSRRSKEEIKNIEIALSIETVHFVKLCHWLFNECESISERAIASYLSEQREKCPNFICNSFETIVAINENSRKPHHKCTDEIFLKNNISNLLIDFGAHYDQGTTDITRCIFFETTADYLDDYALVLKANLYFFECFVENYSNGFQIDTLCRQFLWNEIKDYEHGTGHSIGYLTAVHDLPYRISKFSGYSKIQDGMLISCEPGYYSNAYGIRIEDACYFIKHNSKFNKTKKISYFPIQINDEIRDKIGLKYSNTIDKYNKLCINKLRGAIDDEIIDWLGDAYCDL